MIGGAVGRFVEVSGSHVQRYGRVGRTGGRVGDVRALRGGR